MANSAGMCSSFKAESMCGIHALGTTVIRGATTKDTLKAALFLASASISVATTAYSTTGEVTGTNYTAGGITVTNGTDPAVSGTTAIWTPTASFAWTTVTLSTSFDCCLLYNSTQTNRAIASFTFGATTITAGNFSLTMPANDASNALLRIA